MAVPPRASDAGPDHQAADWRDLIYSAEEALGRASRGDSDKAGEHLAYAEARIVEAIQAYAVWMEGREA